MVSYANLKENGCPDESRKCRCFNPFESNNEAKNLEFICNGRKLGDFDLYGLFRTIEKTYASPDEDDRQEKTAADDSDDVLTLGSNKPKFFNLNITNTGLSALDFSLLEQAQFKTVNIVNNRKIRQVVAAHLDLNEPGAKFSFDKLKPLELINDVTESVIIEGSPLLGQGKSERVLFDQLSKLKALRSLTVATSGLKFVPDQAFAKAISKKLNVVDLKENRIREIGERAFAGLPALNRINLDGNNLVKLQDSAFGIDNPKSDVIMLFLRFNRLNENSFTDRTFDGLENHHVFIYLSGNRLKTLPESVFAPLLNRPSKRKTYITLFDNPINCDDCSLRWLFKGKDRYYLRVYGAVCKSTGEQIWKLPADHFEERCGSN